MNQTVVGGSSIIRPSRRLDAPRFSRRVALAAMAAPFLARTAWPSFDTLEATRSRATAFLWNKQADDGGWHSETYGLLRSGQALTPFVLHTLLHVPVECCPRPTRGVDRGLDFIRRRTNESGVIGLADPDVAEYPNYSTAYALRSLVAAADDRDESLRYRMRDYLVSEQFREANGFDRKSPAFGGWGFGGRRPAGSTGHMDIAHTRRVLDALRDFGSVNSAVFDRSLDFLRFLQRHPSDPRPQPAIEEIRSEKPGRREPIDRRAPYDGGFYFSPVVLDANKGGSESSTDASPAYFRSYATATCDGILALAAAGVDGNDERIMSARRWLERHSRLDYPEGVPANTPTRWGDAIFFYHVAVRAEVYRALDWPSEWRQQLAATLAARQRPDGSFFNTRNHLMKEDDPLLATALAVIGLTHARSK